MLPRCDVPFQTSSRVASQRFLDSYIGNSRASSFSSSQPIKGFTSIYHSQEPNALSCTIISLEPSAPSSNNYLSDAVQAHIDMALDSFIDDSDFPELDPLSDNSSRVSSAS
uniref:Uncharacterized protein n=1 Tax=Ditylenchus dipsaci TaxID=166011 RepID=A0A915EUQ7_9BILA